MNDDCLVKDISFRVHHTMLPVADLDRSVAFYTRLLGMKVKERHASEARKVDVGLVGYGDKASEPFLELIEDISVNAPAQVTPANIHIGIDASDLRKLCAVLEKEGVTFMRPLKQRSDGVGLSAWIRDPDGHEIELAERHPRT
jgi:lactoylglutathione lyase